MVTSCGITMHMNNYQAIITSVHFCETVLKFIVAIATYLCWYLIFIERYSTLPEMYCFAWMLLLLLWLFNWLYTAYVYATHISLFLRRVNLTFVAIFAKCFKHLLEQPMMLLTFVFSSVFTVLSFFSVYVLVIAHNVGRKHQACWRSWHPASRQTVTGGSTERC